jgi:hypothetical protein
MVNTFILGIPLEEFVPQLDTRRLGKQRVEAYQILNLLFDAKAINQLFEYNLNPLDSTDFKCIFSKYKKESRSIWCYHYHDGVRKYSFSSKLKRTTHVTRKVGGGFSSHPMVLMWLGYERGLKRYINLCIQEWLKRGYTNTMLVYPLKDEPSYPHWIYSESLHKSHRSALLRKELVRKEPKWYWGKEHLTQGVVDTPWYHAGYLWVKIYKENYTVEDCDPIRNDFV